MCEQSRDCTHSVHARISTQGCSETGRTGERGESPQPGSHPLAAPDAGFAAGDVNTVGPLGVLPSGGSSPGPSIAPPDSAACRGGQAQAGPLRFSKPSLTHTGHFRKPARSALITGPFQANLKPSKLPTHPALQRALSSCCHQTPDGSSPFAWTLEEN